VDEINRLKKRTDEIYGILEFYKDLVLNLVDEMGVLDGSK